MADKKADNNKSSNEPAYHAMKLSQLLGGLQTSGKGLAEQEAQHRLEEYGFNELAEGRKISLLGLFINQFKDLIIWILIAAVVISMFLREFVDGAVILAILTINAIIGLIQEYRAEKAIAALKKLAGLKADVFRDGQRKQIDARLLVPGDVILLETGDKVPADCRLIEAVNLEVQESVLTGESTAVAKEAEAVLIDAAVPVAERKNMAFSSTVITKGKAKAVVVRTGMKTEVGRIATLLEETEEELTPLQKQLGVFGKRIGSATIAICAIVFLATVTSKAGSILELFKVAVSLAVAAIPEGLPAIVTVSLGLGIQRMARRNALVRKLPSVETLGSTSIICADKTGTLTMDQMTVRKLYVGNEEISVTGKGYSTEGSISKVDEAVKLLLRIGVLCNDAALVKKGQREGEGGQGEHEVVEGAVEGIVEGIFGDPTEAALLVSASKAGIDAAEMAHNFKRIGEVQFDSKRKRMSTANLIRGRPVMYTKGAPDVILNLCSHAYSNGRVSPLNAAAKKKILEVNERFGAQALRVLGFAYKPLKPGQKIDEQAEKGLIFVGLQAMTDPPRAEVKGAIALCKKAGIKVVMITGDHRTTAQAIAKELGLEGNTVTGEELDRMGDEELLRIVNETAIYARVSPEHKLKIISALKGSRHIVAMTGDGVNDAPALKKADIGIAMGSTGTDVAREASKMVLTDDNFVSITNAIEEGRGIYDNIKKFIYFLLSSNLAEVLVIFLAVIVGMPLPMVAIQLLWINLVTDGLPALALGVEPISKGTMERKPRSPGEGILTGSLMARILLIAATITAGTLLLFYLKLAQHGWRLGEGIGEISSEGYTAAITMAFTALVMFELFNALASKSETKTVFSRELFNNPQLLLAIISSMALQFAVVYLPVNKVFHTARLGAADVAVIMAVSFSVIIVDTAYKLVKGRMEKKAEKTVEA